MTLFERIYGCLLGGACGDALGAPIEFLSQGEIMSRYGPEGITRFDTAYGGLGLVTDDTQMTLFTVEGLIRSFVRGATKGICNGSAVVNHAYRRWLVTQDNAFEALESIASLDGWLIRERRLWARRAPGNTCLSEIRDSVDCEGGLSDFSSFCRTARNTSKGCGTVMRDATWGFAWFRHPESVFDHAAETAKTTHGHPSAWYASGALAVIIAYITQGRDLPSAVEQARVMLESKTGSNEVHMALGRALALSRMPDWRDRLPELGGGWVADEALAISVLCALAASDTREAIIAAVNHGGDSDSTGAITGNIVGALRGTTSLPREWTDQVELGDVIHTLAEDLTTVLEGSVDPDELWDRYPGW